MAVNGSANKDISSKQAKFVDALLVGSTVIIAAKTAGISPRTAARWKKDRVLLAEVQNRRREQFNETLDAFRSGLPTAMALVLETMKDKECGRAIRLRAAQIWIEHALQVRKIEDLEARLAALEERLER